MKDQTKNSFRAARGRLLRQQILDLSAKLGRKIRVLDVGGRARYWDNVGLEGIESILVQNYAAEELEDHPAGSLFSSEVGDARNLSQYADGSFDLVHANSVIEHVGGWSDMEAMAREVRRVGLSGWIQTPAWEFPIEPHYRLPMVHWLSFPARRWTLSLLPKYRAMTLSQQRMNVERINLISQAEMRTLFPETEIYKERFLTLTKSYTARWMPE